MKVIDMFKSIILMCLIALTFKPISSRANDFQQIDRSFIIRNEGIILFPYKDRAGIKTICVGHRVLKSDRIKDEYSIDECMKLFEDDLNETILLEDECLTTELDNNQFTATTDFTFNLGAGNFCLSSLLRDINKDKDNYKSITRDFEMWNKIHTPSGEVQVNKGLQRRRYRESQRYNLR